MKLLICIDLGNKLERVFIEDNLTMILRGNIVPISFIKSIKFIYSINSRLTLRLKIPLNNEF